MGTEMGVETSIVISAHEEKQHKKKLGGIRTLPFILGSDVCDIIATFGAITNLISYLTLQLHLPLVKASNIITNLTGTQNLTPILGALIADSWAGNYWSIVLGSIFYELGLILITFSAIAPGLRPPACQNQVNCKEATGSQLWVLYMALFLIAIGAGGIKPCLMTFAAGQVDMRKSKVEARKWNFFNWYYICIGATALLGLTVIVYIQENVGWGWGFGIPAVAMALSIVLFLIGTPLYKMLKPAGSPFTRLAQVVVAAVRKRNAVIPADSSLLYQNEKLDASISTVGTLLHTNNFRWVDKAAIVTDEEATQLENPNLWRLATVHRVEELKSMIRILPIWASGVFYVAAISNFNSLGIEQARTTDRHLSSSLKLPPAGLTIFTNLSSTIMLIFYERVFVPYTRKLTKIPSGITCLQRIGIGHVLSITSTVIAILVEIKRKNVAAQHGLLDDPVAVIPISIFWLVPQFCIHGIAEMFNTVGRTEFLYDQSPESMRSTGGALYYVGLAIGNYMGTFLVQLVHRFSDHNRNWVPNSNLNRGRLEFFYLLVSGIQLLDFIYYLVCASFYTYKPLVEAKDSDDDEDNVCRSDRSEVELS